MSARHEGNVWVFQYTYWDDDEQRMKHSERFATWDTIKSGLGTPVMESGKPVPEEEVFAGFHRPAKDQQPGSVPVPTAGSR